MRVSVTYPEMVTGSSKTGELHSKYKVLLIRKRSNRLPVNSHQNMYTMGGRRHITKILAKPYQNRIFCLSLRMVVYKIFTCGLSVLVPKAVMGDPRHGVPRSPITV